MLTQKVDRSDDLLGFFHNWLTEFSKNFEKIIVICLFEGEHSLPNNVKVYSLGKEKGISKIGYVLNFYRLIKKTRKEYDSVFIHMNTEYLFLGGLLWKFWGKKIYLWFNHAKGNVFLSLSHFLTANIFAVSKHAYVTKWNNTILMPAGVDTQVFKNFEGKRKKNSILVLGRISPVKHLHDLTPALRLLKEANFEFTVSVYGESPEQDRKYGNKWKESVKDLIASGNLKIYNSVANHKTPEIYNSHEIYINLTPSGSFDKTILEAMSCGAIPIVANKSFDEILTDGQICKEGDSGELADKIKSQFLTPEHESDRLSRKLVTYVENEQSLNVLVKSFINIVSTK